MEERRNFINFTGDHTCVRDRVITPEQRRLYAVELLSTILNVVLSLRNYVERKICISV